MEEDFHEYRQFKGRGNPRERERSPSNERPQRRGQGQPDRGDRFNRGATKKIPPGKNSNRGRNHSPGTGGRQNNAQRNIKTPQTIRGGGVSTAQNVGPKTPGSVSKIPSLGGMRHDWPQRAVEAVATRSSGSPITSERRRTPSRGRADQLSHGGVGHATVLSKRTDPADLLSPLAVVNDDRDATSTFGQRTGRTNNNGNSYRSGMNKEGGGGMEDRERGDRSSQNVPLGGADAGNS